LTTAERSFAGTETNIDPSIVRARRTEDPGGSLERIRFTRKVGLSDPFPDSAQRNGPRDASNDQGSTGGIDMPIRHAGSTESSTERGGVRVTIAILSASGAALVGVIAAVGRATKLASAKGRGGYNCCEFCATPLRRDPQHTWRYSGTCAKCGRVQPWAPVNA
jgi:hypothetical protein